MVVTSWRHLCGVTMERMISLHLRMKPEAPPSYEDADDTQRDLIVNGCGPQSWKFDLIPDRLLGISVSEICNIHDWEYVHHEGRTRKQADKRMLSNMRALVRERGGWLMWPRLGLAWFAYLALRLSFSGRHAWE